MQFTGRTWRPPYEAHSCIIQLTSGCTYHKCRFCSLYKNEPFYLSPLSDFEKDLVSVDSLTLFPDIELYTLAKIGKFIPAVLDISANEVLHYLNEHCKYS